MLDEKHLYDAHESLPIPTYEEATSSRPPSQLSRLGPEEVSDDAERQGLLGHDLSTTSNSRRRNGYYHPPSVQSVRSSEDSDDLDLPEVTDSEDAELRREMEQMEILDPEAAEDAARRRNRLRSRFSKRFSSITTTLSGFPFPRIRFPSFGIRSWISQRVPSIPEQYRPGWGVIARLFGLILVISLIYLLFVSEIMPMQNGGMGQSFNPEWVRSYAQGTVKVDRIKENLKYITSYDHVAGSEGSLYLGKWIETKFAEAHMDRLDHQYFHAYLNYPKADGRRVAIVNPPELAWEAKLEEDSPYPDPTPQQTLAYHGMSRSGNVTGPLIYANYGSKDDFKRLADSFIDVTGAIILVRAGGTEADRARKVKNAEEAGAAGCLIYSDPKEDGFVNGKTWPDGRWRPSDSIERGTVALTNLIAGDVLTPGYASTPEMKRISKDGNPALVNIPSLPLAWRDAQKLLQSLKDHGQELPEEWVGGVPEVDGWWSGDKSSPTIHLMNLQEEIERQTIFNVQGSFEGIESKAKEIIVGNHRDSWCFGAADPGSGTAVMLEVATILGQLRVNGWRPLRTIKFASWDAEEYNCIGSTEYVENYMPNVRANALAYINVNVGVSGDRLFANGSPLFKHIWMRAIDRVSDPRKNQTLRALWDQESGGKLGGLAASSDYVAFQHMAGTSSIDFGFEGDGYPYHSCYETFEWMSRYGDPDFTYHTLLAEVWVLLILELAQEPILPHNLEDYAESLPGYIDALAQYAYDKGDYDLDVTPLREAAATLDLNSKEFHAWEEWWAGQVYGTGGFESNSLTVGRLDHNARMGHFDTHLLDLPEDDKDKGPHGIPGREQYKHVILGPSASGSRYDAVIFPFVRDALDARDWPLAQKQVQKTADILRRAADKLLH